MFGPLDLLLPYIEYVLFVLVLVNAVTRVLAHRSHVNQYREGGAETISRYLLHDVSNAVLLLAALYFMTVHFHGGVVLSVLILGLLVTDFFEFEARKVEARKEDSLERPKGALGAWTLVFLYAAFQSVFFVVEPLWKIIVG